MSISAPNTSISIHKHGFALEYLDYHTLFNFVFKTDELMQNLKSTAVLGPDIMEDKESTAFHSYGGLDAIFFGGVLGFFAPLRGLASFGSHSCRHAASRYDA